MPALKYGLWVLRDCLVSMPIEAVAERLIHRHWQPMHKVAIEIVLTAAVFQVRGYACTRH